MWWYVVHAKESVLSDLETKWDQVNVQTGWKLELCFMAESTPSPLVEAETEQQPASKVTIVKTCHHKLISLWLRLLMLQALLMLQCQMLKIISLTVNHQMTWIERMTQQHLIALEKMNV